MYYNTLCDLNGEILHHIFVMHVVNAFIILVLIVDPDSDCCLSSWRYRKIHHSVYHGFDGPEEHIWSLPLLPASCCQWTPAPLDTPRNNGAGASSGPAEAWDAGGWSGVARWGGLGLHQAVIPGHSQGGACRRHRYASARRPNVCCIG
jgi:hypothetical protein